MTRFQKTQRRMLRIERTDSANQHFQQLVEQLDQELAKIDGEEHEFYHQFNSIDNLKYCLVAYLDDKPVACGAIKSFDEASMEVKRMYTSLEARGKGIATKLLIELEDWAKELAAKSCLLETGKRQQAAVALYKKIGYEVVPNYGQYIGIDNSLCFKKEL